jgi:hypothetical protein
MSAIRSALLLSAAFAAVAAPACATVTISKHHTAHMRCAAGTCSPTAPDAVLNVDDLEAILAERNATVTSNDASGDIRIAAALSWASASTLTLSSLHAIDFGKVVTVEGSGGLALQTDDEMLSGDLNFTAPGRVVFRDLSSSLTIKGAAYTLVGDIATLASDIASNPSGNYALAQNYDAGPDGTYGGAPVTATFTGIFEGLGNTISDLTIVPPDAPNLKIGLFPQVSGTLRDIVLEDTHITVGSAGLGSDIGALAALNGGPIVNAVVIGGSIVTRANSRIGGLVGTNGSIVSHSRSSAAVRGGVAGGLVGTNSSLLEDSFATGNVTGNDIAGGLVGDNEAFVVRDHATGTVTATQPGNNYIGGLAGWNDSPNAQISQSYATGAVAPSGGSAAGGLVGRAFQRSSIVDCYALSPVTSSTRGRSIGGLVGGNTQAASLARDYSVGAVLGGPSASVGGSIGADASQASKADIYWDLETSGVTDPSRGAGNIPNDPGLTGIHDTALRSSLPAGFDPGVWGQNAAINGGLPYLLANPPQ